VDDEDEESVSGGKNPAETVNYDDEIEQPVS